MCSSDLYEAGILEDPWFDPTTKANKGMFKLSVSPEDAPNKEEYLDSEKYQLRHWPWDRPNVFCEFVALVNRVRRENPALQSDRRLRFYPTDNDQLLSSYKSALNHAATAARKLNQHAEAAVYLRLLDDEGVPARESEASKKRQWIKMAGEVASEYAAAEQWDQALPYARRAAEIAGASRADLKRAYAVAAAHNGDWSTAGHEAKVTLMLDSSQRAGLLDDLAAVRKSRPQDGGQADSVLRELGPAEPASPTAPP